MVVRKLIVIACPHCLHVDVHSTCRPSVDRTIYMPPVSRVDNRLLSTCIQQLNMFNFWMCKALRVAVESSIRHSKHLQYLNITPQCIRIATAFLKCPFV